MKKRILKILPVATAAVLVSSQQLLAYDSIRISRSLNGSDASNVFESTVNQNKQQMYAVLDTNILSQPSSVASAVERVSKGASLYVVNIEGEMCQVLTESGNTGYVSVTKLTDTSTYVFHDADAVVYVQDGTEVRTQPDDNAPVVNTLSKNTEVHVTGVNEHNYTRVSIDGGTYYIHSDNLSENRIYTPQPSFWTGAILTPGSGTIIGPSGKETYYNLNMSVCVANAQRAGAQGEYWVREDGVKMLGDYVMVAANFAIRPLGTIVPTSLGMGIVVDTGGFALNNPTQLDIAVAW
ncbi:MAG: SH3 domain-containing protein [Bulleidia sp.]